MRKFNNTQIEEINQALNNVKNESFIVNIPANGYDFDVKVYYAKDFDGNESIDVRTIAIGGEKCDFYSALCFQFNDSGLDKAFEHLTGEIIA